MEGCQNLFRPDHHTALRPPRTRTRVQTTTVLLLQTVVHWHTQHHGLIMSDAGTSFC